ncbi:hypothetical protein BsWGS_19526 [Bradybaena similaris]
MSTLRKLVHFLCCSSYRRARPQVNLHRHYCGTVTWWPLFSGCHRNQELKKMAEKKEPPDWKNISCSFDHTGKRHILPVSLLMQLTSLVKDKKGQFASQILKEGLTLASTSFSALDRESLDNELTGKENSEEVAENPKNAGKRRKQGDTEKHVQEKKKKKELTKRKSKKHMKLDSSQELPENDEVKAEKKRPNFFVAVQITNPEIHSVAKNIQLGIQETAKVNLRRAIIEVKKFHITLMVMHLPDKEGVQKAVESLDKCVPSILERTCGQPITLDFEGLSTFSSGRVLFASPKASQGLDYLHFMADEVSAQMKHNGIVTTDRTGREFNPHLTLLKFDRHPELRRQGIKRVEPSQYQPYVNEVFGTETITSLQLCHMEKKRADGYYLVEHEAFFNK